MGIVTETIRAWTCDFCGFEYREQASKNNRGGYKGGIEGNLLELPDGWKKVHISEPQGGSVCDLMCNNCSHLFYEINRENKNTSFVNTLEKYNNLLRRIKK